MSAHTLKLEVDILRPTCLADREREQAKLMLARNIEIVRGLSAWFHGSSSKQYVDVQVILLHRLQYEPSMNELAPLG